MNKILLKLASVLAALSIVLVLIPQATVRAGSNGTADFVTRFYQLCLGRTPDAAGIQYWVDNLESGKQTGANVARGFVQSPEFTTKNVSNEDYINIMYAAFFNRTADAAGFASWSKYLDSGTSRYYVLAGFTNSKEFANLCESYGIQAGSLTLTDPADVYPNTAAFVTRFYKQCLGRGADSVGLNNWVANLQSGAQSGCDVAYGFVFSPEFQNRNVSDAEFINIMYRAFFNRSADAGGYAAWKEYLGNGYTRHYVLAGFVNSQEFKNLCASYNIAPGSLPILEEDSSISKLVEGSGFTIENGYVEAMWGAHNTSGKRVGSIQITYAVYDKSGNPLVLEGKTSHVIIVNWSGVDTDENFLFFDDLGGNADTCGRIDIPTITLFYGDGSSQTINYAQSLYELNAI